MSNIILLLFLILLNAFFAASEMAFVSLNDNKIDMLAEEGNSKAKVVKHLLNEPTRFLSTIQIGITLAGFLNSAFAADSFSGPISNWLAGIFPSIGLGTLQTVSVLLITVILSYVQIVLGELVPKRIAMRHAEKFSFMVVGPMRVLSVIASPFVKLLTVSTNVLLRLVGIDPNETDSEISEEEIRMMVDVGQEKGGISTSERTMINNIFDFDNSEVSDIMTHRTEIEAIDSEASLAEVIEIVDREKYSRFPVYKESIDNIIGILYVKDLLTYLMNRSNEQFILSEHLKTPYFVPDSKKTDELFFEFQKTKVHIAIVIDEYGGTGGLITMEDLIEEIMGEVFDEYDEEEEPEFTQVNEDEYTLQGSMDLEDVAKLLKIEMPEDEFDTLSGFIVGSLGYLPDEEDHSMIEFGGYQFTIVSVEDKVVKEIHVKRHLEETEEVQD